MKLPLALGLRGRLILLLLAAFAVLTALIAWHTLDHRDEHLQTASEHLLAEAKLVAARQQSIAAKADAILTGLMLRPELRPGASADDCSRALAEILRQEPKLIQVARIRPDGVVDCAAVLPADRVSLDDRDYFRQALQSRKMVVSDMLIGRLTGKPSIVLAKAMHDEAGRVSAVFYLGLNLDWLHRELAATRLPEDARLVVVDGRGVAVVRHPDPEGWAGRSVAHLPLFQRVVAHGGEGMIEDICQDGVRKIIGFAPLLDTASGRLYLWLSLPKATVVAPAQRELWLGLAIALAVLVATLGLAAWGGDRLLLRPLLALSRTAQRLSAGDLGARSGLPHTNDEVGRLARTLDESAAAIAERERRLARANRALRVRSAGNQALLRTHDEHSLMEAMCRAIVEADGYRLAWVGLAENDRRVRPVASWGAEADFLDSLNVTRDETAVGRGPIGTSETAIRRGMPVACNDVRADPDYGPWREQAQRLGYASSLALPLRLDGAVVGALNICAVEPDAFDADVVELLGEAAGDLAYGIATQRAAAEHERTQAELQQLERQNTLILDAAGEGIFGLDLEGHATFINPACTAMLQWTAEETANQNFHALHHHTKANGTPYPPEACPIYAAYRDGVVHRETDEVFWRKDGTSFPVEYVSTPLRDERGELAGAVVSFMDVTERKRAENNLAASETKYRTLLENLPQRIFMKDTASVYISCNRHYADDLKLDSADAIAGRDDYAFYPRELADKYRADDLRIMAKGLTEDIEEPYLRNGKECWVHTIKTPVRDKEGRVAGVLGIFWDVTEQKLAEAQLRKLSLAVEQSPESIVIADLDANIEYVNEAFVRITGYAREEVLGQNPRILRSGKTPQETYVALWDALTHGRTWKGELINRRKDGGEYVEFSIIAPIRQADGRVTHYVAVKEDITEKKRLGKELDEYRNHLEELVAKRTEQLTEAQARAEAANLAKSAFLANMSHEIRTPMNAIIGLTHLMKRAGATPEQVERLTKIDSAGHHLLSIINDILDISKIEAGRLQLESTDFHLSAILDNVRSLIGEQARAKGLSIEVDSDEVPVWLRGDPTRLRQALLNYAGNAVKFTEQGTISLRAILLEETDGELRVRFEVRDTGIGIAPETLPKLFAAFEQADVS
ncbi:MAG: PAS domain S-box protein, partial [Rhodocyclaceae bacterium]|nr:PAS domain S-box protein [Rhodocyclaceae bacterium]